MIKKPKKPKSTGLSTAFYKELFMSVLAIASVVLLVFEYCANPNALIQQSIVRFDVVVAGIFMVDFCVATYRSANRLEYVIRHWYLLLAAIPIVDGWAELLRGLRVLELIRLLRAGAHLTYVYETARQRR